LIIIAIYALAGLLLLPFAAAPGPAMPGLSAFFAAGVFVTELSTSFLLFVRFRDARRWSLLVLAAAYFYSALLAIPYLLTFPDAILRNASILGGPQSVAWIFIAWICGFAFLTLTAIVLETAMRDRRVPPGMGAISTTVLLAFAAVAAIAMVAIMHPEWLPPLIDAQGWTTIDVAFSYASLSMLLAGILLILLFLRRSELFLWLALALTAMLFGNLLATASGARFSMGWSVSRLSWVFSGCALFLYFMGQFVRQQRLLGRARDTLEQRVAERTSDLSDMIGQRDLLLREVHHRVKNNFQVVGSLINFQAAQTENDETREALRGLHGRVYALGLVHQRLMQSKDLSTFDIGLFLDDLCRNVATLSSADARGIRIVAQADPLRSDLDFAGPLGLLVTELVGGAFTHFADAHGGEIRVSLRHGTGAEIILVVADDAPPEPDLLEMPGQQAPTRIVDALLKQLSGVMTTAHGNGTTVTVTLPHSSR
jgi:two-component sensor histidine kinase